MKLLLFILNPCNLFVTFIALRLSYFCFCLNKSDFETQADLFKDIADKLKVVSESVPTQANVIEKIKSIDAEELRKIDEKIKNEDLENQRDHGSCPEVSYDRDYSFECPSGWILNDDGTCWYCNNVHKFLRGLNYTGVCDSRQSFKWFSPQQKRDIEDKCCAFWPKKVTVKESVSQIGRMKMVHGSVNFSDGKIVPPRN